MAQLMTNLRKGSERWYTELLQRRQDHFHVPVNERVR